MIGIQPLSQRTRGVNHPRRQQYRRLSHAGSLGLTGTASAVLGLLAVRTGAALAGALLMVVALVFGLRARHWPSLARRSRVGARSEDKVRRALAPLEGQGRRLRHGVRWPGAGDIDSVAIAPAGVGFAIETKTRTYDHRQLGRVLEQARWLGRRRRRWCRRGALAVLCVVRARPEWSATSVVSWWSRSTGWFRCCGKSRTGRSAVTPRRYMDRRSRSATSVKIQTVSSRASVSARLVGVSVEFWSSSAMACDSQLIASCATCTRVGGSMSRRAD
jgi:hypothetical protein